MSLAGGVLGLGLQVDFLQRGMTSGTWIPPDNINDGSLANPVDDNSAIVPELNFGAYFTRPDFYIGISSSQMLAAKTELDGVLTGLTGEVAEIKGERHYFLMGGYNWDIPNTAIQLQPAVLVKSDLKGPVQADLNVSALYNNKVWGGLGYRLQDAFSLMLGYYILPSLRLSYSYDLTTSALKTASSGSHEIMINYCFKISIPDKEPGYYRNPRFL